MTRPQIDINEWRKAVTIVGAGPKGLLAFRQFRMDVTGKPAFTDDFMLRSIHQPTIWQPRQNVAWCLGTEKLEHRAPDVNCRCGFYASYSSAIIYDPDKLGKEFYCFAAIRVYGEEMPFAEYGLRSSGADVEAILFHPNNLKHPLLKRFNKRLDQEGIFYTFSAKEFLRKWPDESYEGLLGFDPVMRSSSRRFNAQQPLNKSPDSWRQGNYSHLYRRVILPHMLQRTRQIGSDIFTISLKPEYLPGGNSYRHPLLEVWDY